MSDANQGEAGKQPDPTPNVDGIEATDFALWRHQPVTKMFLQYLRDRRADFVTGATEQWLAGELVLSDEKEMLGFAKCLGEITATKLSHIIDFYQQLAAIEEAKSHADQAEDQTDDDSAKERTEEDRG